ncbi:MAG: hypothetical protein WAO76_11845 [Georgfuchsia sp.]
MHRAKKFPRALQPELPVRVAGVVLFLAPANTDAENDALIAIAGKTAVATLRGSFVRKWADAWSRHVGVDVSMTLAGILGTADLS